jgi:protein TonB
MTTRDLPKLPAVLLSALVVNVLLFTAIQLMVVNRQMRLTEAEQFEIANFIRVAEQQRDVRSRRDPKAPQKPATEMQQDLARLSRAADIGGTNGMAVDIPDLDIDVDIGGTVNVARELTPLVRFPPEYPMGARAKRTEGYVILRFTVTETGSVADPEVLQAEPPGVFERAAIQAALRWKYQPQIVDGKPARVVTFTRVKFEMAPDQ